MIAEMSRSSLILSLTAMLPLPSAMLNFIPNSPRLISPVTSKPTRVLPNGPTSEPPASAISVIAFVTPCSVRSPAIS